MKKFTFTFVLISLSFSIQTLKGQTINTFAGTGTSGNSGDGGPATAAEFHEPYDIKTDAIGNIYIVDDLNNSVRVINTSGIISLYAGNGTAGYSGDGGPATAAKLNTPDGLYINRSIGSLYISDAANNRLRVVNSSGFITTIAGHGIAGYSGDGGPATAAELNSVGQSCNDSKGNIYIADVFNNRVRVVDTAGIIRTFAGNGTAGFSGDGGPATAAEINNFMGVICDQAGNLYISDLMNNRIRVVNTSGIISTYAGTGLPGSSGDGGPATAAKINGPTRADVDSHGNLFIVEYNGYRIREVNTYGYITTVAGTGLAGYSGDGGAATSAQLRPIGLDFDLSDNLYIVDYGNYRIREVTGIPLSVSQLLNTSDFSIYPNPSGGQFNIELSTEKQSGKTAIEVYNILGEKVYSQILKIENSTLSIDLGNQSNGIYLVKLQAEDGSITTKKIEIAK